MSIVIPAITRGDLRIVRANEFRTQILEFESGREQRMPEHGSLARFTLDYTDIGATDRDALLTVFDTAKGCFDSSISFTQGNTYPSLALEDDSLMITEASPLRWNISLRLRQTAPGGAVAGSGTTFPALATGALTQLPYSRIRRYETLRVDMESGQRYAWANWGAGLTGYPPGALAAWGLSNPLITAAEAATIEAHFVAMRGAWKRFTVIDPDTGVHFDNCRYASDSLELHFITDAVVSINLQLIEFNH